MTTLITPEIPKGTRDFLPKDMVRREFVLEKIKSVFVNFGYDTIETPAIEYAKTIHGNYGENESKLTYTFNDHGGRKLALRYDQTVPFARFVASNYQNLPMPFKRYQISPVWRADKPARGRYREFHQCDIDIIGTDSLMAEGEIARVIVSVFEALGFEDLVFRFNSRRLMNNILSRLRIALDKQLPVIRLLDKLEKIGKGAVGEELRKILPEEKADALLKTVGVTGTNEEKMRFLEEYSPSEIREFIRISEAFEVPTRYLKFDPSLSRGLDYYTGLIFKVSLPDVKLGAVCAGGRYDDLCSTFSREKFSGVGAAFAFDRIMLAMEELDMLKDVRLNSQVLVTYLDEETLPNSLRIVNSLREAQINAEIYFQSDRLSKQLRYAEKKGNSVCYHLWS